MISFTLMIPQKPNLHPLYLPDIDKRIGQWINLCSISIIRFIPHYERYLIRFIDGSYQVYPIQWGEIIENELRLIETNLKHSPDETD